MIAVAVKKYTTKKEKVAIANAFKGNIEIN